MTARQSVQLGDRGAHGQNAHVHVCAYAQTHTHTNLGWRRAVPADAGRRGTVAAGAGDITRGEGRHKFKEEGS